MASPRLQAVRQLRDAIFGIDRSAIGVRTGKDVLAAPPLRAKLLNYYPPDVDMLKLSMQDSRLAQLDLKDVWVEQQRAREEALAARGKVVRVSVITGPMKRDAAAAKSKGKKRR
ncbi:hypothetical protein HK105_209474 [Polyrhizophydium stewartii]|uniref:Uncharacterized protein n=1 Tax=Polyrhizophydium stewartii TaxID=2732419 RepID=A0ABR4MV03_9FUNG|nr:hypothetical protein HK105_003758 [Polyrhizophydium stewartii]